jgi:hypothetical protein
MRWKDHLEEALLRLLIALSELLLDEGTLRYVRSDRKCRRCS